MVKRFRGSTERVTLCQSRTTEATSLRAVLAWISDISKNEACSSKTLTRAMCCIATPESPTSMRALVPPLVAQPAGRDYVVWPVLSTIATRTHVFSGAYQLACLLSADAKVRSECVNVLRMCHRKMAVETTPMLAVKRCLARSNESCHKDFSGKKTRMPLARSGDQFELSSSLAACRLPV